MKNIHLAVTILGLLSASSLEASMGRILRVADSRTIIVDYGQTQSAVTLRGVDATPSAETTAYLQTLVGSWVLVDSNSDGTSDVYRSPDALFLNDAARRHGTGLPSTLLVEAHEASYLGVTAPGPQRAPARTVAGVSRAARARSRARPMEEWRGRPRRPSRRPHPIRF